MYIICQHGSWPMYYWNSTQKLQLWLPLYFCFTLFCTCIWRKLQSFQTHQNLEHVSEFTSDNKFKKKKKIGLWQCLIHVYALLYLNLQVIDQIVKGVLDGLGSGPLEKTRPFSWEPSQMLAGTRTPMCSSPLTSEQGTKPKNRTPGQSMLRVNFWFHFHY